MHALRPVRNESGLLWEGFSVSVSKETGKVESIAVWLYGTNGGVGHYHYTARVNTFRSWHGDGHFNLMAHERKEDDWEIKTLRYAASRISQDVSLLNRPLRMSYDEDSGKLAMFDPELNRAVFINENRSGSLDDLFVYGPPG